MDEYTSADLSLYFITALIPVKKAIISMMNEIGTVTFHQVSSKESIPSTLTKTIEITITIKKKVFSPTDHFPSFVLGLKFIFLLRQSHIKTCFKIKNSQNNPHHGLFQFSSDSIIFFIS